MRWCVVSETFQRFINFISFLIAYFVVKCTLLKFFISEFNSIPLIKVLLGEIIDASNVIQTLSHCRENDISSQHNYHNINLVKF